MSDIDTGVVVSLKVLDPDGRLEKRTNSAPLRMSALCPKADIRSAAKTVSSFDHLVEAQSWIVSPIDITVFNGACDALRYIRDTRVGAIVT